MYIAGPATWKSSEIINIAGKFLSLRHCHKYAAVNKMLHGDEKLIISFTDTSSQYLEKLHKKSHDGDDGKCRLFPWSAN